MAGTLSPHHPSRFAAWLLVAAPEAAYAQEVPLWVAAGLFSPLVMLVLAAILGWLRRSALVALAHGVLIVVWVSAFVLVSQRAESDLIVWAPVAAYGLHGVVLVLLLVVAVVRRHAIGRAGP